MDRQNFIPWANEAAGKRGIAIGDFGPPFSVVVTVADSDGPNVFVWPGGRHIVPQMNSRNSFDSACIRSV